MHPNNDKFWRDVTRPRYLPKLTLFYREGCHLCEDMEQNVVELLQANTYRLDKVDIDTDPQLKAAYNVRVPVLKCDEIEVCEHFLDLDALREALAQAVQ